MISLLQGSAWDWYIGGRDDEELDIRSLTQTFKEHYYEDSHNDYLSKVIHQEIRKSAEDLRLIYIVSHYIQLHISYLHL